MKKKAATLLSLFAMIIALALVVSGCSGANDSDANSGKEMKISIGKVPYPDMWPAVYIIRDIAEELGYKTEIIEAEMGLAYQGLAQGSITVFPDVCLPVVHQPYVDKYQGQFEIVGTYYSDAPSGFTVPNYVDINSVAELAGRANEFRGRVVGIEPSAGLMTQAADAIEAYGLDGYELLESSTPAMLGEVKKATSNNEPVLFLSWRPHPMWLDLDIKILEDTKGIFPKYDVKTGVDNNLKDDAPDLYKFIQEFTLSLDDIETMLTKMETEDADIAVLAKDWIEQNRATVDGILGK